MVQFFLPTPKRALFVSLARVANFGWSGGGVPGTSRPYRHAQTTADDLLFQDLFSDWKTNKSFFFEKIAETKIPVSILGQIQVRSTTFHPLPRNLGGVCGYLPGKSRPYFYAQSTALDLLCQDLSSAPKNIYFYFIKYCIKVKYLGISPNVRLGGSHPNYPSTPSQELPGVLRVPSW